jgi:hypothetical protein
MKAEPTSRQILFNNSADFLRAVEQDIPLGNHASLFTGWEEDVRELSHNAEVHSEVLEAVLEFRRDIHAASRSVGVSEEAKESVAAPPPARGNNPVFFKLDLSKAP